MSLQEIFVDDCKRTPGRMFRRRRLAFGVSSIVMATAMASPVAFAQDAEPEVVEASGPAEEEDELTTLEAVSVTGSRLTRSNFESPSPLTVIGEQELEANAPANVADFVNQLPSVVGSLQPSTTNLYISSGMAGLNTLNLRALGTNRTLVLLDGQRSVPSAVTGAVDVNTFPQGLIESVEVVTGGASAAYGSDAVSGVVNFILDTDYEGIKGSIEGGETTYGDDASFRVNLSAGTSFGNGRGHLLLNGEYTDREGIYGNPRDWNDDGWYIVNNPAYAAGNGEPERFLTSGAGLAIATPGGIIVDTPLRGTYFGQGGTVNQLNYGASNGAWMIGGDWEYTQTNDRQSLHANERRDGLFGRLSWEFSDNLEVYGQAAWNSHESLGWTGVQANQGNVVIQADNAFLPDSVRQQLQDQGISQFRLGTTNADLPLRKTDNEREVQRYVLGANGAFDFIGRNWQWDAYYQYGKTETKVIATDITNNARLSMAQDAVVDPGTGDIVCRSTLSDPDNGCIPFNRFGIDVNSQAAVDWVIGNPYREDEFTQEVYAANISGDLFENWAGLVSGAAGIEHRTEEVSGYVPQEFQSGWFVGNYKPTFGSYDVTEAYFETLFPVADGLDFNGAVRVTDYSTSGMVTTWKAGATYEPIPDITFRVTRSRDIRAPNLAELFQTGSTRTNNLIDPFNNNDVVQFRETTSGNLDLDPEEADQWNVGVVVQPRFAPGLRLSADYYEVEINDAIGTVTAQTIVDRCFEGQQEYCSSIVRGASAGGADVIESIQVSPFNFAFSRARGIDFEAAYSVNLQDISESLAGDIMIRAMGTHFLENYSDNGIDTPTDTVGQNIGEGPPDFLYRMMLTYTNEALTLNLIGRGISEGVYDNSYVVCTTACPASTIDNRTINRNHIDGAFYIDLAASYDFELGGGYVQPFLKVTNLFNEDPAIVAYGPGGSAYGNSSTNPGLYDTLGRVFRVGARFEF
ncbi:TonB-dependent receptor [Henriciella sp.]|uniref:TonB-dependent receptor domain-containing protein n=1 Tax=Henriciella sp. TaxID=1968823 RepID=UPI002606FBBF|nr:TonB-dependent receptor [Henriciella sp.]